MADNAHSLRIWLNDHGNGLAGHLAGAPAGYALFAERSVPLKPVPPGYGLFANAKPSVGAGPLNIALTVERQRIAAEARRYRTPYRAIGVAIALHLAILLAILARGGPPDRLGIEDGLPENLNVSVISSAELRRLADPFRQEGSNAPSPAPAPPSPEQPQPSPEPPQPPTPEQQQAQEAKTASASVPTTNKSRDVPFDPSGYAAMAADQFASQLTQAFKAADARRQVAKRSPVSSGNVRALRPGASHNGKSDQFARDVIWALGATKPMGNGKWGTTVVTFTVTADGQPGGLKLLKSSGDDWLDKGALMAVKQARLPIPPPGLTTGDRGFVIEYVSTPGL